MPGGVLGFEPMSRITQRVEPVPARQVCKRGAELGDVFRRRRPVHRLASCLASRVASARIVVMARPNSYRRAC